MYDVKEMVRDGKQARLVGVTKTAAWYVTETGFQFPVPCDDMAEGKFLPADRAILLMRYINKQIAAMKKLSAPLMPPSGPAPETPTAELVHVTQHVALYAIDGMEVPVALSEIGDMVLLASDDADRLAVWKRKHIDDIVAGAQECAS